MPRFVLLYHACPPDYEHPSHWDLMLEASGALRTWALSHLPHDWHTLQQRTAQFDAVCPSVADTASVPAQQLADHRLAYLEMMEVPVSGGRGHVTRIEAGAYSSESQSLDCWQISLAGCEWCGQIMLQRTSPDSAQWTLSVRSRKRPQSGQPAATTPTWCPRPEFRA